MAAVNLHYPKMKVFQLASTQVASGAKIYTYEAGTSTDKATYSDQGLTSANANPVIADSNGEAQVWLKDDGLYKIVIDDSSDVLISSVDNLGTTSATTTVDGAYSLIPNGSFEANTGNNGVPDSWVLSIIGASTIDIDTGDQLQGLSSLQFVGGASGAGTATTSGFFEVQASKEIAIRFALKASLATVGNTVKFLWYTSAQAAASVASTTVYNVTTSAPTTWVEQILTATPGSDVKYGKVEISGSTTAGTTNYDDVVVFNKESILPKVGSDIASATELPVNVTGDYHDVTGTVTVTSFAAVRVGTIKKLQFDGALILTHHATDLILPGAANITTAAGDEFAFIEYASGDWRCIGYTPAAGIVTLVHDHNGGDGATLTEDSHTAIAAGTTYGFHHSGYEVEASILETAYAHPKLITYPFSNAFVIQRAGTYRCQWEYYGDAVNTAYTRIYKNGIGTGVVKSKVSDASYSTETDDLTFAAGDLIEIWGHISISSSTAKVKNFEILGTAKPFG